MYHHILVAVDSSPTSHRALQEAIGLAQNQHARLRIVHVVDETSIHGFEDNDERMERLRLPGREILREIDAQCRQAGVNAECQMLEYRSDEESVAGLIIAEAERWPADIVVLGTHGRTGLAHLLMGSVADGVIRGCAKPVLLLRKI